MVYKWLINNLSGVLPSACHLCGTHGGILCPDCHADLPRMQNVCARCGSALASGAAASDCGECLESPPHFQLTFSPFAYRPPLSQLITALKYQRRLSLVPVLTNALAQHVERLAPPVDALLPVPLHPGKLCQRGFNQALELARPLAKQFGLPLIHNVERQRATASQSSLDAEARQRNVRDAFSLRAPIHYQRVAIIDDVMTTGSTVNEIARLLASAGVEQIQIWCIARA